MRLMDYWLIFACVQKVGYGVGTCTTTEVDPEPYHMCSFTLSIEGGNYTSVIGYVGEMSFADGGGGFLPIESFLKYTTVNADFIDTGSASFTYTNLQTEYAYATFEIDFSFWIPYF